MSDTPRISPHRHPASEAPSGHARATAPALTRDIGQAERALRALLERQLGRVGLSFPAWTVLVFLDGGGSLTRAALVGRQVDGHVVPTATAARATVEDLLAAGLLTPADAIRTADAQDVFGDDRPLARTTAADAVYRPVRDAVARVTHELYGDLPASDLEITSRTLGEIARRANAMLAVTDDGSPAAT